MRCASTSATRQPSVPEVDTSNRSKCGTIRRLSHLRERGEMSHSSRRFRTIYKSFNWHALQLPAGQRVTPIVVALERDPQHDRNLLGSKNHKPTHRPRNRSSTRRHHDALGRPIPVAGGRCPSGGGYPWLLESRSPVIFFWGLVEWSGRDCSTWNGLERLQIFGPAGVAAVDSDQSPIGFRLESRAGA